MDESKILGGDFLYFDFKKQKAQFNKIFRAINPKLGQYENAVSLVCVFDSLITIMKEYIQTHGLLKDFIDTCNKETTRLIQIHIIWCDYVEQYIIPTFGVVGDERD